MKKLLLVELTEQEFEDRRGKTFGTAGTNQSSAPTKYPTTKGKDGHEYHSTISFDTYEEYLEYNKPTF